MSNVQKILEKLLERGFIDYGKRIPIRIIEEYIGGKIDEGWNYRGPYLELKIKIEDMGYFLTSRGEFDGSFRILSLDEMSYRCDQTLKNVMNKQKHAVNVMRSASSENLQGKEREQFQLALQKAIMGMQSMKSVLYNI